VVFVHDNFATVRKKDIKFLIAKENDQDEMKSSTDSKFRVHHRHTEMMLIVRSAAVKFRLVGSGKTN